MAKAKKGYVFRDKYNRWFARTSYRDETGKYHNVKKAAKSHSHAKEVNASWSLDSMYDSLYCGKRFRTLNVIDKGVRECLAIEVDTSLRAEWVVKVLERLKGWRGTPRVIRLDNVLTQKSSTYFEQYSSLQFQLEALAAARHKSRSFARCRGSLRSFLTSASLRLLALYREAVASPH